MTWLDALLVALVVAALAMLARDRAPALVSERSPAWRQATSRLGGRAFKGFATYHRPLLRQAGFDPDARRWDYWLAKLAAAVVAPLLLVAILATAGGEAGGRWLLLLAAVGFFLPDLWLLGARRRRRQRVARALPYFLDLLVAFLYSGLSLIEAFRRAGREGFVGRHPMAREVAIVGRELDAGQDPSVAFRNLAENTGVSELRAVASALRMGLRLGAPVRETLQIQADALWTRRREQALRQIHRAEIQVIVPVVLSGFPIFGVLTWFPILIALIEALGELTGVLRLR